MTRILNNHGNFVPVTIIKAGPCIVTKVDPKVSKDFIKVEIGFGRKKRLNKPLAGYLKGLDNFRFLRSFRVLKEDGEPKFKRGDKIDVSLFKEGELLTITGISKGKGFQGVIKRYGFAGKDRTHGTKHAHRQPGSIGSGGIQRVAKGKKLPGRAGNKTIAIKNLQIIKIDKDNNLMAVKGSVPATPNSVLKIKSSKVS